jgi:hypothetical protein
VQVQCGRAVECDLNSKYQSLLCNYITELYHLKGKKILPLPKINPNHSDPWQVTLLAKLNQAFALHTLKQKRHVGRIFFLKRLNHSRCVRATETRIWKVFHELDVNEDLLYHTYFFTLQSLFITLDMFCNVLNHTTSSPFCIRHHHCTQNKDELCARGGRVTDFLLNLSCASITNHCECDDQIACMLLHRAKKVIWKI